MPVKIKNYTKDEINFTVITDGKKVTTIKRMDGRKITIVKEKTGKTTTTKTSFKEDGKDIKRTKVKKPGYKRIVAKIVEAGKSTKSRVINKNKSKTLVKKDGMERHSAVTLFTVYEAALKKCKRFNGMFDKTFVDTFAFANMHISMKKAHITKIIKLHEKWNLSGKKSNKTFFKETVRKPLSAIKI